MSDERLGPVKDVIETLLTINKIETKRIGDILSGNPIMKSAIEKLKANDVEGFYFELQYNAEQAIEAVIEHVGSANHLAVFLFTHSEFVNCHFQKLFERIEGFACCADKSRTIVNGLANFLLKGVPISFNPADKYTYHHPKRIFTKQESIVAFLEALCDLRYGKPERYLAQLKEIYDTAKG